jgi:adenylate kinase family enzyme
VLHEGTSVAIVLRGAKGAGKSTVARLVASRLHWPLVVTGDVVRRWSLASFGVADGASVRRVAESARGGPHGVMGAVLRTVWPDEIWPAHIVIDSVREPADTISLRRLGYAVVLVTLVAPFEARLSRVLERGRSDDSLSSAGLHAHDEWERNLETSELPCDVSIEVTPDEIGITVSRILSRLRLEGIGDA